MCILRDYKKLMKKVALKNRKVALPSQSLQCLIQYKCFILIVSDCFAHAPTSTVVIFVLENQEPLTTARHFFSNAGILSGFFTVVGPHYQGDRSLHEISQNLTCWHPHIVSMIKPINGIYNIPGLLRL